MNPSTGRSGDPDAMVGAVAKGDRSACELLDDTIERISQQNDSLACFTDLTVDRARAHAAKIDAAYQRKEELGPLAGVPYGVKNLFDLAGLTTRAGSKITRDNPPASVDAYAVRALQRAGANCVGALNMGEYAYDFTGENAHDGHCRNPHDPSRMAGGSSSGPAAAVAAGMVPFALGSDTNGSIRVPASYCGLFGLKPTFGRLSRSGTFPFCSSLDHIGPLARSTADLALVYDALLGDDPSDAAQNHQAPTPIASVATDGIEGLRLAIAGGYFTHRASSQALAAVNRVAKSLDVSREIEIREADRARAAALIITATESASLHLDRLQSRASDFDPMMRDRLLAGAMIPVPWISHAQRFRLWYQKQLTELFKSVDILLAPATPTSAFEIGQKTTHLGGEELAVRQAIGIYTQPISFAGLPVVTVPLWLSNETMPIGVQVIAAPWQEHKALQVAYELERRGVCAARIAEPHLTSP